MGRWDGGRESPSFRPTGYFSVHDSLRSSFDAHPPPDDVIAAPGAGIGGAAAPGPEEAPDFMQVRASYDRVGKYAGMLGSTSDLVELELAGPGMEAAATAGGSGPSGGGNMGRFGFRGRGRERPLRGRKHHG